MGTNAFVIKENDGKYKGIHVNFDGDLQWCGRVLFNDYSNENSLEKLFKLGNLSSLNGDLDQCVALGRDYGRKGQHAQINARINDFGSASYIYVFKNEKWYVSIRSEEFIELKREML